MVARTGKAKDGLGTLIEDPAAASIQSAKRTLARAFAGLRHMRADDVEAMRQVAEKGWRAVREAIYAVMECATGERPRTTIGSDVVEKIESRIFGRPRGQQPLTQAYSQAIEHLHGGCFYEGACPSVDWLHDRLEEANSDIRQAEADLNRCLLARKRMGSLSARSSRKRTASGNEPFEIDKNRLGSEFPEPGGRIGGGMFKFRAATTEEREALRKIETSRKRTGRRSGKRRATPGLEP